MKEHDATEIAYRNGYADGKPKWISVKDRLPEESGNYIVTACDEDCPYGEGIWYDTVVVVAEYYKGCWTWYENGTEYDLSGLVTHWMNLPEPPEEDDKPMTNADRIRAMSDEEMAKCIFEIGFDCHLCSEHERLSDNPFLRHEKCDEKCTEHCLKWLQEPAEEV